MVPSVFITLNIPARLCFSKIMFISKYGWLNMSTYPFEGYRGTGCDSSRYWPKGVIHPGQETSEPQSCQPFRLTFTPMGDVELPINLTSISWTVLIVINQAIKNTQNLRFLYVSLQNNLATSNRQLLWLYDCFRAVKTPWGWLYSLVQKMLSKWCF